MYIYIIHILDIVSMFLPSYTYTYITRCMDIPRYVWNFIRWRAVAGWD